MFTRPSCRSRVLLLSQALFVLLGSRPAESLHLNATHREGRFLKASRSASERIADGEAALESLTQTTTSLYGVSETVLTQDIKWYAKEGDAKLVSQFLRAIVLEDKFVVSVGGMSDTAGHGNMASEAYPMVLAEALKPVFARAGVRLVVRNMGMGGVPSFPNSVCLGDFLGDDTDLVVWDYRMVEHDEHKGELYLRQALMLPRAPSVLFKREQRYLQGLGKGYAEPAGLHALDETKLFNALHQTSDAVKSDKFCNSRCTCPGQVRWHAGWKMHRLRGLQMAVLYAQSFSRALAQFKHLVHEHGEEALKARDWSFKPVRGSDLPALRSKNLSSRFADSAFKCGLTWSPRMGRSLMDLVDTSEAAKGGTKWRLNDPNKRISDGGKKCGYSDDKTQLEGTVHDGWVFFPLQRDGGGSSAGEEGTLGFCAEMPTKDKEKRIGDFEVLVLVNGEEVQDDLEFWMDARTLGISIQCYGTSKMVRAGENVLGFRVMQSGITLKLTHVIWR
eukprot:CAMPEP_0172608358 /NCGR_PEP_ID=MMETSP1068-20121228/28443_1 /TAXON_ID=35684 /ORGANISM="Pseudopedinella elastica, Strain CCMP716" /LENGTH=502 /DNA_ID=CAMNT_0013411607 /DNA_START=92 /DNA_END=1600 /DNA_ORIENTATION=-